MFKLCSCCSSSSIQIKPQGPITPQENTNKLTAAALQALQNNQATSTENQYKLKNPTQQQNPFAPKGENPRLLTFNAALMNQENERRNGEFKAFGFSSADQEALEREEVEYELWRFNERNREDSN